jgi:hypothetical protein
MKKYARFFDDGRVIEVHTGNPETDFVASIAAEFEEVPEDVAPNDKRLADGTFEKYVANTAPEAPEPQALISEPQLKAFMTRTERIAYKAAADSDPIVGDFAEMLALQPVALKSDETVEAIDKLEELSVLTAARATELKSLEV